MRKKKSRHVQGTNALDEAEYIIRKAQERTSCVVTRGVLCYFSTLTGDAWMLDPEDDYALCLAVDGDRQNFRILETDSTSMVEWQAKYTIDGDTFIVVEPSGRMRQIFVYPTREIQNAIRRAQLATRGKK